MECEEIDKMSEIHSPSKKAKVHRVLASVFTGWVLTSLQQKLAAFQDKKEPVAIMTWKYRLKYPSEYSNSRSISGRIRV